MKRTLGPCVDTAWKSLKLGPFATFKKSTCCLMYAVGVVRIIAKNCRITHEQEQGPWIYFVSTRPLMGPPQMLLPLNPLPYFSLRLQVLYKWKREDLIAQFAIQGVTPIFKESDTLGRNHTGPEISLVVYDGLCYGTEFITKISEKIFSRRRMV